MTPKRILSFLRSDNQNNIEHKQEESADKATTELLAQVIYQIGELNKSFNSVKDDITTIKIDMKKMHLK